MQTEAYPRTYGSYLLLEPLGQGGMSEVELARRAVDDARYVRFVVIKRIHARHTADPGFIRMFQDEARINAELHHENIAQVYDFGHVGDEWYLAMEYVPGLDLRGAIKRCEARGHRLPLRAALRVVHDILRALAYAHGRVDTYGKPMRIVHRDVNPRNVMLSVRGEIKLIDFGVAKADTRSEHTQGEVIKGKFAYMAPEQIESTHEVDGRADLFAVGLMLYELLTGEHPFAGLREIQIVHKVLSGAIPDLPDIPGHPDPDRLRRILRRALARDVSARYADAEAFRRDLEAAAVPLGGLATPAEMADLLRELDPHRTEGIAQRLQAWRDLETVPVVPTTPPPPADASLSEPSRSTSMSLLKGELDRTRADPPAPAPSAEPAPPPSNRLAWVLAGGGVVAALVALLGVGVLAVVVPANLGRRGTPAPAPSQVEAAPEEAAPAPGPEATAPPEEVEAAADPDRTPAREVPHKASPPQRAPAPEKATPAPARTSPAPEQAAGGDPPKAAASPAPEKAAPAPEKTAPPPDPAAGGATADAGKTAEAAPAPAASPPPAATDMGYLFVTSKPDKGYEVRVNGQLIGKTPIGQKRWPVGPAEIVVTDTATGRSWRKTVTVEKGKPAKFVSGP